MSNELIARAQLFAGIEGGINFWAQEVLEKGPIKVLDLCKEGEYREDTASILKANGEQVLEELAKYQIELIAPSKKFDELPAPPIALTIKGNKELFEEELHKTIKTWKFSPCSKELFFEVPISFQLN